MNLKKNGLILATAFLALSSTASWADDGHTFPVEGKTYLMHRFKDQNSYVYENSGALCASPKTNTQKQYWKFIPTKNANCYYIQNATSKQYVQSSSKAIDTQIKVGSTPVEFEIKKNTTSGAAPYGYYYICSTDQKIDVTQDGTLGLNYQQSTGKVVSYHIRYNRGNSYWDINETPYDYEAPAPIERSNYCKQLGIYILPCGIKGAPFLTFASITGEEGQVKKALNYTSKTQPADYYKLVRTDSAEVTRGATFQLKYDASRMTADHTVTAYWDWDKDGIFETQKEFLNAASGSIEVTVPDSAAFGRSRMRIRITDNGLEEADDDVSGMVYDFQIFVTPKQASTGVGAVVIPNKGEDASQAAAYGIDGRRVKLDSHKGAYIQARKKRIK